MAEAASQNESVLDLVIPEAESLVAPYRLKYDPSATVGVPAHVTVLYPFLPPEQIDDEMLSRLAALFADQPAFRIRFEGTGRFPDVLYLEPQPAAPIVALTEMVAAAFPEYPPYGGIYPTVMPHLTIAHVEDDALLQQLDQKIMRTAGDLLPISSDIRKVTLYEERDERWSATHTFPLTG